jgi:sulfur carrier protein
LAVSGADRLTVTVTVAGEGTEEVTLPAGATYADLLAAVGVGVHEGTVLVDGRPAPEDEPVDIDADADAGGAHVLRLIRGG